MVCTEETLQSVKKTRSELNALFESAEEQRKNVKNAVMQPYMDFEAVYKECVSNIFKTADADLKGKIASVEDGMKETCEKRLREFFDELAQVYHLDFLKYEQAGVVVSLTDARAKTQPPKKLRDQLEQFFERVAQDAVAIASMENADEIAAEYKQTLNLTKAISTVNERHKQIAEAKAEQDRRAAAMEQEAEAVRRVEAFAPPVTTSAPEQVEKFTCTFTVVDTKERLKLLKQFLDANKYQYT